MGGFEKETNEDFRHSPNQFGGARGGFGRGGSQAGRGGGGMIGGRPSDFSADEDQFDRRFGGPRERSDFPTASSSGRNEPVNPMFQNRGGSSFSGSRAEEGPSQSASSGPTNPMFDSSKGPSRFSNWQGDYGDPSRRNLDPPDHRALGLGDPYPAPGPPKPTSAPKRTEPEEPPLPPGHDAKTEKDYAKLIQQEKQFDTMFERWEKNFEQWKTDNENNPDLVRFKKC